MKPFNTSTDLSPNPITMGNNTGISMQMAVSMKVLPVRKAFIIPKADMSGGGLGMQLVKPHLSLAGAQVDGYVSCSLTFSYGNAGAEKNSGLTLRFYLDSSNPVATANTFNE